MGGRCGEIENFFEELMLQIKGDKEKVSFKNQVQETACRIPKDPEDAPLKLRREKLVDYRKLAGTD